MLHSFSHALIEMYESAENVDLDAFPADVIRQMRGLVRFDGAVLGMGESSALDPEDLVIHNAFVHGRDPTILADYAAVSSIDPMTHRFVHGLQQPLTSSLPTVKATKGMEQLLAFHKSHDLQQLMLFGQPCGDQVPARWLVLYRGTGDAFDAQDSQHLAAVWPHLARAISINRSRFLEKQRPHLHGEDKGAALVRANGCIEVAEPLFRQLCALEWPAGIGRKMPDAVWDCWRRGLDYVGTRVKFAMQLQHDDLIVSQACTIGPLERLTPAEQKVATRFAAGQSAKTIANELGISVHTVRSQIADVYRKLDVHDKAELASCLLSNRAH